MKAVAAQNTRAGDPVYHVILSWPDGENPTDDQVFACGAHALSAVDMAGHQYVFAIHRDTDNVHLHIAVNRIHPDTFTAVYPQRDYFKLDRAMRELELRYSWQHDNGPYVVTERNGRTIIERGEASQSTQGKRPAAAADMERHADQESLFSYARGAPRRALLFALKNPDLTWRNVHNVLAKYGLEIREKGQGFAIYDANTPDATPIKASDMHEELSRARLTRRLGPFEAVAPTIEPVMAYDCLRPPKRDPVLREERRQARAEARRDLRARYAAYKTGFVYRRLDADVVRDRYAALRIEARRRRQEVRDTVADPAARKALYSVIAFETLRERDRLRRAIQAERDALRADPANRRLPYREWVEREAAAGDAAAISQLRGLAYSDKRRATILARALGNNGADGIVHWAEMDPAAREPGQGITFRVRRDGTVIYRTEEGQDGFVDMGRRIDVLNSDTRNGWTEDTIAAALALAAEKYGGVFELTGSEAFKRRAIDIMLRRGISARLKDAAQEALKRERAAEIEREKRAERIRQPKRT
jgi:hypothetical protein